MLLRSRAMELSGWECFRGSSTQTAELNDVYPLGLRNSLEGRFKNKSD